uniref:FBD domain-containing protein n=1 Tax=Kalanchoe fedtschenkoi TaxID=63787 RepID=A0A7N0U1C0_KALFE
MMESDYMDAVNTFLLFHSGPIRNILLHLPFNVEGPLMQAYVDKWIRVLSKKGVRELTLDARARTFMVFNLPSYVFDYLELRHLELRFCQFKLPYNFGGFQNLTNLQLLRVRIYEDGLTNLIANCPLLQNLSIERYFGSLSINAPKLKTLRARSCGFKDFALRNVSDVVTISLRHTWTKKSATRPFRCDILKFFGSFPKLENLTLGEQNINVLAGYDVPKTLPTPLECLMHLTLLDLHLDAPKHISCALRILRSSPYLQTANFKFLIQNSIASVEEEANVVAFLEDQFSEADSLSSLLTVKVKGLMGTRPQIMFLKFILTSSSALKMVYANAEANISRDAELTMMCELMECSRASNKAEMSYSRNQGITAVSYSKGHFDSSIFNF